MTFISYAQNLEDVMLWRALGSYSPGRYVDVGAQDPLIDSVGRAFHEAGWNGVHVEPLADYAAALREAFPHDTVIEAALSKEVGSLTLYELPGGGLSTVHADIALYHQENAGHTPVIRQVATTTLAMIFEQIGKGPIHWLKIDVEGHEREVLEGWGSASQRPWVVLVESTFPTTDTPTHEMWEDLLIERDYTMVYVDGLNRFYLHKDHQDLEERFRYPPNVFDNFELNGTATSLTTRLARQHEEEASAHRGLIEKFQKLLERAQQERAELDVTLLSLRQQCQLEQKGYAAELERLRSAGKVAEAMERTARDLTDELHRLRAEASDAKAHRHLAVEKAEIASAEARMANERVAEAQAQAARSAERAQTAALELARMQERAETLAREIKQCLSETTQLREQIDNQSARIAELAEQLRWQTEISAARTYSLLESRENAERLAGLVSSQAEIIGALEDRLRQQTVQTIARTYSLHLAESDADTARAEVARLGQELAQHVAAIGQMDKLVATACGEVEELTDMLNRSLAARLLSRLGLLRIKRSRAALLGQQAALIIEQLSGKTLEVTDDDNEWGRTTMSTMPANDVNELLAVNGAEFVDVAYRTLLKRSPDRAGRDHFLDRLRAGHGKEIVILAMADSPEARALPDTLPGLLELRARQADKRKSRGAQAEIQRLERTMNRLEFSIGEMHARTARQSDRILERLEQLENKMATLHAAGLVQSAATSNGDDSPQVKLATTQTISSLVGQVTETTPVRFIDQLRDAVRQSTEAATIADNAH